MKRLLLNIFLLVCVVSISAQKMKDSAFREKIKKAKIATKTNYFSFIDKPELGDFITEKRYYDKEGKDTLIESFSITDSKVFSKIEKKYDEKGNILELKNYRFIPTINGPTQSNKEQGLLNINENTAQSGYFELEQRIVYELKEKGNLLERKEYNSKGELEKEFKSKYTYSSDGKLLQEINYDNSDTEYSSNNYTYDQKGNKTSYIYSDSNGKLKQKEEYFFDSSGNEIKQLAYKQDGILKYQTYNKYDEKGNKKEKYEFDGDSVLLNKYFFSYDNNNNMIEYIRQPEKSKITYLKILFTYDEHGNILSNTRYEGKSYPVKLQKFVYTFYK